MPAPQSAASPSLQSTDCSQLPITAYRLIVPSNGPRRDLTQTPSPLETRLSAKRATTERCDGEITQHTILRLARHSHTRTMLAAAAHLLYKRRPWRWTQQRHSRLIMHLPLYSNASTPHHFHRPTQHTARKTNWILSAATACRSIVEKQRTEKD